MTAGMEIPALQQLAVSLGLGLLLGVQRERTGHSIGGIRTFPLIALFGTICAQLAQAFGGWVVAAGLLALAAMVIQANFARQKSGTIDPGMTTEIAALLLFALGAYLVIGNMATAVVLGGAMAILLHLKQPMHRFAGAIGDDDMRAIMQFVLVSLVILPVLPNRDYGPYGVWNPFQIWLMVVLIVGISLSGYVAYKFLGARAGTLLSGVLGGLISSTATTVSYARRSTEKAGSAVLATSVILIASCMSLARVLVEIATVAPRSFASLAPPIGVMLLVTTAIAGGSLFFHRNHDSAMPEPENPAQFRSALIFGTLFALVLLAVAVVREHFGSAGLYVVGIISGLTDMDAITLSAARMVESDQADASTAWRTIVIAAMSNVVFKFGTAAFLGHRALTIRLAVAFSLVLLCASLILWLWPT